MAANKERGVYSTMKSKKSVGFYISLLSCILAVVSAIAYGVLFSTIEYKEDVYDINIIVVLIAAAVIAVVLLFLGDKTAGFAPAVMCLGSGLAIMFFIVIAIWPVSDTIYGIEPFPEITELIICAVLIVATWLIAEVSLYMKKYKTA